MRYTGRCYGGPLNGRVLETDRQLWNVAHMDDPLPLPSANRPFEKTPVQHTTYRYVGSSKRGVFVPTGWADHDIVAAILKGV